MGEPLQYVLDSVISELNKLEIELRKSEYVFKKVCNETKLCLQEIQKQKDDIALAQATQDQLNVQSEVQDKAKTIDEVLRKAEEVRKQSKSKTSTAAATTKQPTGSIAPTDNKTNKDCRDASVAASGQPNITDFERKAHKLRVATNKLAAIQQKKNESEKVFMRNVSKVAPFFLSTSSTICRCFLLLSILLSLSLSTCHDIHGLCVPQSASAGAFQGRYTYNDKLTKDVLRYSTLMAIHTYILLLERLLSSTTSKLSQTEARNLTGLQVFRSWFILHKIYAEFDKISKKLVQMDTLDNRADVIRSYENECLAVMLGVAPSELQLQQQQQRQPKRNDRIEFHIPYVHITRWLPDYVFPDLVRILRPTYLIKEKTFSSAAHIFTFANQKELQTLYSLRSEIQKHILKEYVAELFEKNLFKSLLELKQRETNRGKQFLVLWRLLHSVLTQDGRALCSFIFSNNTNNNDISH